MDTLRYGIAFFEGVFTGLVDTLNYELSHSTDNTFVFDIKGMPLNLTMTRYPEFNHTLQEIMIHIDAQFDKEHMTEYVAQDTTWADYAGQKQRE